MEERKEVSPDATPNPGVVRSLGMAVTQLDDGRWAVRAAWLDGPVIEDTWPEAYWSAVKRKPR